MDLRREGSLGARGSMDPRREGSLGGEGSDLRPDETLVESFSVTQRERRAAGPWSPLWATTTEILALSLSIETCVDNEIALRKHVM
jgi:hypothetical protein